MSNIYDVQEQMEAFGVRLRSRDLPLQVDLPRKRTCGLGGKWWYRLYEFRPDAGGVYIVGAFGSYKTGDWQKVEVDWTPLTEAERERFRAERERADQLAAEERRREAEEAAIGAAELWSRGRKEGRSPYLERKGVLPEACRFMADGSVLVPLIRYDLPRHEAFKGIQRIYGGPRKHRRTNEDLPQKTFTKNFDKPGCAVRLGDAVNGQLILVCEGYATGLTLRMAIDRGRAVFVCLDAGNLLPVMAIVRGLFPLSPLVVCADDDWKTVDQRGRPDNVGRRKAAEAVRAIGNAYVVYPAFGAGRGDKDTDFNDLHKLEGIDAVRRQLHRLFEFIGQEALN